MTSKIIKTDICIVGAGPAGLTASLTLSKQNIPHLLVDSCGFPRQKPCADIITSNTLRSLNEIDPEILISLKANKKINPIWNTTVYPTNGKRIIIDFLPFNKIPKEPSCYSISRLQLDNVLFLKASESKIASIKQNCHIASVDTQRDFVKLTTKDNEVIHSQLVIVATGSNNSLLKHVKKPFPDKHCSIGIRAYFTGVECEKESSELILSKELMPGGLYIAPLPGDVFNVNLVMFLEHVNAGKINLRKVFDEVISSNQVLKKKFANATRIGNFEGSKLFMGIKKQVISEDRILITGDTAGLIDIITGNGIPQAMISGKYSALKAAEALKDQNFSKQYLQSYDTNVYAKVTSYLLLGRILYPFLRYRFFCNIGLRLINFFSNRPQTNILLRDLLFYKNPYYSLLSPTFYYKLFIK